MREKFLSSIRDAVKNSLLFNSHFDQTYGELLDQIYFAQQSDVLLKKVESFLSKWAVQYGHNSLKDSAQERIAVENVTIRAAKWLEYHPQGAYQEKSTRYVDFSKTEPILSVFPEPFRARASALYRDSLGLYQEIMSVATIYYLFHEKVAPDASEAVRRKTATAKAFDVARYVIPAYAPTSLGITASSRTVESLVRFLLAHENEEARELGAKIKTEVLKVNPALIKHVSAEPSTSVSNHALASVLLHALQTATDGPGLHVYKSIKSDVRLTTCTESSAAHPRTACAVALASSLYGDLADTSLLSGLLFDRRDTGVLAQLWQLAFEGRGPHDEVPEALDAVFVSFEGTLDFGAYRDMQRHRRGSQQPVDTSVDYGYSVPEFLKLPTNKSLCDQYEKHMIAFSEFRRDLDHATAQYALCLGHNVKYSYACSVKQLAYILELRTGPSGHASYRKFCQSLASEFFEAVPEALPYIRVNWESESTRATAEATAEKKAEQNAR